MTSAVYAAGDKTTAISNIKSAVEARIATLADGSQQLNTADLRSWLLIEAQKIILDSEYEYDANASNSMLAATDFSAELSNLAATISRAHWQGNPEFPQNDAVGSGTYVSALQAGIAQLRTLSSDVSYEYQALVNEFADVVRDYFTEAGVEGTLPDAVTRVVEDRFYVSTFVTDWDEESAPSPVSDLVEMDQNDTVTIGRPSVPSGRHIDRWRLYRSNAGSQSASFQFVDEIAIGSTSYTDEKKASQLQEPCPTFAWLPPPDNLAGLVNLPNGVMAGYFGNTECFSVSFVPYAWPVEQQMTVDYPIIGHGVFGQTLVCCHYGGVDYFSGADGASMSRQKGVSTQVCASARSIVGTDSGVFFASQEGICLATPAGVQVLTEAHFTREDWEALDPSTVIGAFYDGCYCFLVGSGAGQKMYMLSMKGKLVTANVTGSAIFLDKFHNQLYVTQGTNVVALFANASARTGTWKSKKAVLPKPAPFAWLQVDSDFTANVTVRWYGDGTLRHTVTLTSREPVRLPAGRYKEHELEIESAGRVTMAAIYNDTDDLQDV